MKISPEILLADVTRMLTSFGPASNDRCLTYALDIAEDADCEPCIHDALVKARREPKQPTIRRVLEMYREERNSDRHGLVHIGMGDRDRRVSEIEAEWRGPATEAIMASTGLDKERARYQAGRMWASQAVLPADAAEEALHPTWAKSLPKHADFSKMVELAFDFARAVETTPPERMTDEEWDEISKPWGDELTRTKLRAR